MQEQRPLGEAQGNEQWLHVVEALKIEVADELAGMQLGVHQCWHCLGCQLLVNRWHGAHHQAWARLRIRKKDLQQHMTTQLFDFRGKGMDAYATRSLQVPASPIPIFLSLCFVGGWVGGGGGGGVGGMHKCLFRVAIPSGKVNGDAGNFIRMVESHDC